MPDWTASMQQTFEYYTVDPGTWKDVKQIRTVKTSSINRDSTAETLGSATINITESLGECYIRIYLITIQNGLREKHPLGTFLVQTPSTGFDGKVISISMDAYTPLMELKENPPPIGYSILEDENILENAYNIVREHARAPVVRTECEEKLFKDFVANTDDTWASYTIDLLANAKHELALDELGRILFAPKQEIDKLQPIWEFNDGENSIIYPDFNIKHDMHGVPNAVEVIYSDGRDTYYAKVVNDDPNSPISTVNRGREILYREPNPSLSGIPNQDQINEYAKQLLQALSTLEYTITFSHGYCPVRLGDCVRLNCERAGINNIKAKITGQNIKCEPGCPVSATAVFTVKLWR